jgi:hypothetical protein
MKLQAQFAKASPEERQQAMQIWHIQNADRLRAMRPLTFTPPTTPAISSLAYLNSPLLNLKFKITNPPHTMKPKFKTTKAFFTSVWFATIALVFSDYATAVDIVGDTVQGNLTVTGNSTGTGWGWFKQGIDFGNNGEAMLNWTPGTSPAGTVTFDITWADGTFTWRDTVTTTASNKMSLDAANNLLIYKSNGTAGITLAPETGKITLPAGNDTSTGSGIYFGTSTAATLAASATGAAIFPSQVTLQNGLNISSGNMNIASPTASTTTTSGALTVSGGVGVVGAINTGADSWINGIRVGKGGGGKSENTVVGGSALGSNIDGDKNTVVGSQSLMRLRSGYHNSAFGLASLHFLTSGSNNTGYGAYSLYADTHSNNTAVGYGALFWKSTGSNNSALGQSAGSYQSDGSKLISANNSIYIGADSRGKDNSDNNSIVIGCQAIGEGANTTVIGNTSTVKIRLFGDIEASAIKAPSAPDAKLMLKGQVVMEVPQGDISMGIYE